MRSLAELELKLELTKPEMQRIGTDPALEALTVGKPETSLLRSLYFDTPDHRLRAQGISLRLRSSGERSWVQTIKATNGASDGIFDRRELETTLATPEPDLEAIGDRRLRRKIARVSRTSSLEPLFETVVRRTIRKLHAEKGDLELAFDEGVVRAGKDEGELCEAELELKAGSPACLLEVATKLFASGSLRLARMSKADRGYNLLLGRQDQSIVPRRALQPTLKGDESSAEALALFVQSANAQMVANRSVVLETDDPDGAHQLCIGLRRLRSALQAFRRLDDSSVLREIDRHAGELARAVDRLDDADMLIEDIFAAVAGRMKGDAGFAELRESLAAHRVKVRDEVRQKLLGGLWSKLQLYVALWSRIFAENSSLRTPVRDFAPLALSKGWKKLARLGSAADRLSIDERRALRKALKKFRYTVECFASLHAEREVAGFIKELKKLRDVLRPSNEAATAQQLTSIARETRPASLEAQRAAGYVVGWHDAHGAQRTSTVSKAWRRLEKRSRFWN